MCRERISLEVYSVWRKKWRYEYLKSLWSGTVETRSRNLGSLSAPEMNDEEARVDTLGCEL